jgi:threonine/homoserine/homoserine lactone efflux protein
MLTGWQIQWDRDNTNYHLIIGLVVLICLTAQPALGAIHHAKFKKLRRRQVWSYLHLFNGRIFITLGIIDGALGLWIARESSTWKMVYLASAGVIWSLWMAVAIWSEWRRRRGRRRENRLQRRAMGSKFNDWDVVIRN